jgi:hypothetical protein
MAPVVWGTNAGFSRVLLPLYGFALIAVGGGLAARRRTTMDAFSVRPQAPTLTP